MEPPQTGCRFCIGGPLAVSFGAGFTILAPDLSAKEFISQLNS